MAEKSLMQDLAETLARVVPSVQPEQGAQAVFCVLAQRVSSSEGAHLVDQLPDELRSALRVCISHPGAPSPGWNINTFQDLVADHAGIQAKDAPALIDTVLAVLHRHLDKHEAREVGTQLPAELRIKWDAKHHA